MREEEIVVGFDYGSKKIGVAVGNLFTKITSCSDYDILIVL